MCFPAVSLCVVRMLPRSSANPSSSCARELKVIGARVRSVCSREQSTAVMCPWMTLQSGAAATLRSLLTTHLLNSGVEEKTEERRGGEEKRKGGERMETGEER